MAGPVRVEWRGAALGAKLDECADCRGTRRHDLVREIRWVRLGPLPVLPTGIRHGLRCSTCGAFTPLPRRVVSGALRAGSMPLPDRPRPALAAGGGSPADLDRVVRAGGVDGQTLLVGAWVVVIAVMIAGARQLTLPGPEPRSCLREVGGAPGQPLPDGTEFHVEAVPCSERHNFEVLRDTEAPWDLLASMPPSGEIATRMSDECEAAYAEVFHRASAGAPVELLIVGPGVVGWMKLDRSVQCLAWDPATPWQVGSYREGTARAE